MRTKEIVSVVTPTYNRAYILNKCYESLKIQTSKSFVWMIVDDGSTDNTEELVNKWLNEGILNISKKKMVGRLQHSI
jgi:glycosyltransferase involved in cell wall biosynthesis